MAIRTTSEYTKSETISGTATLDLTYDGGSAYLTHASANTVTVPLGMPVGWRCRVTAAAAAVGTNQIAMASGVTGLSSVALGAAPWTVAPGAVVDLEIVATDVCVAQASLGAAAGGGGTVYVATRAALKAIAAANRVTGMRAFIPTDRSTWMFDGASSVTADGADMLAIAPTAGSGRWLRADSACTLKLAFTFATADAAVLLTVPAGFALRTTGAPYWDISASFTGGAASAIGISSSNLGTDFQTKGDILGGAGGDVLATLVAGVATGTVGDAVNDADAANTTGTVEHSLFLTDGKTIRFDRITSAFTAGAGCVCIPVAIVATGAVT